MQLEILLISFRLLHYNNFICIHRLPESAEHVVMCFSDLPFGCSRRIQAILLTSLILIERPIIHATLSQNDLVSDRERDDKWQNCANICFLALVYSRVHSALQEISNSNKTNHYRQAWKIKYLKLFRIERIKE